MKITEHAKQRYAERIKKLDTNEAKRFVIANSDMICDHIEKMMQYAILVYKGASLADSNNSKDVSIYIKDSWILIYDDNKDTVITLYTIDLGLGKEFNDKYIDALMFKIKELTNKMNNESKEKEDKIEEYNSIIRINEDNILNYKSKVKSLEEQNDLYRSIINSLKDEISDSKEDLRNLVSTLIKKKVF